jgi:hypothetical protein
MRNTARTIIRLLLFANVTAAAMALVTHNEDLLTKLTTGPVLWAWIAIGVTQAVLDVARWRNARFMRGIQERCASTYAALAEQERDHAA